MEGIRQFAAPPPVMADSIMEGCKNVGRLLLERFFWVGFGYDVLLPLIFFSTMVSFNPRTRRKVSFDVLLSFYLLYATYTRNFIIRNTKVSQWIMGNFCSEGSGAEVHDYVIFSVISWVSSSSMEYTSSRNLVKLFLGKMRTFSYRFGAKDIILYLVFAIICTINSISLTLVMWGLVQQSLGVLSNSWLVVVFQTMAALFRLIRQLMEGVTLMAGFTAEGPQWRNPRSKMLFGHIAFSSSVLLVHTTALTCTFAWQDDPWKLSKYIIFLGLCVDILFRLFTCGWAALNSCCMAEISGLLREQNGVNIWAFCLMLLRANAPVYTPAFILRVCRDTCTLFTLQCVNNVREFLVFIFQALRYVLALLYAGATKIREIWKAYFRRVRPEDDQNHEHEELTRVRLEVNQNHEKEELIICPRHSLPQWYRTNTFHESHPRHLDKAQDNDSLLVVQGREYSWTLYESYILPFPPWLSGEQDLPQSSDYVAKDYSDPTNVGEPFSHLQLEVGT